MTRFDPRVLKPNRGAQKIVRMDLGRIQFNQSSPPKGHSAFPANLRHQRVHLTGRPLPEFFLGVLAPSGHTRALDFQEHRSLTFVSVHSTRSAHVTSFFKLPPKPRRIA